MQTLPPIGSLVAIQADGVSSPYYALVTGHPHPRMGAARPVVEVMGPSPRGCPYHVYLEYVKVVGK